MTRRGRDDSGKGPVRIDGVLGDTMDRTHPTGGRLLKILERFKDLVSESTLAHARPTSLKRDVLFLTVTDPVWKSELMYFLPAFLEAFNGVLGEKDRLREIRIRVGSLPPRKSTRTVRTASPVSADPARIPHEIRQRIQNVQDPALRELMIRVASRGNEKGKQSG